MARLRSSQEETWNALTHVVGFLISFALYESSALIETKIACVCMMITYTFSVLYHWARNRQKKDTLRMLDILSIHISIGGMSTAYCIMLDAEFSHAVVPVVISAISCQYVAFNYGSQSFEKTSVLLPTISGLTNLVNIALVPVADPAVSYFYVGCFFYLFGILFYVNDRIPYFHTIWHVFVVLASTIQIFGTI